MSRKNIRAFYVTIDSIWAPWLNLQTLKNGNRTSLPTDTPFSKHGCDFCGVGRLETKLQTYKLEDYFKKYKNKFIK